MKLLDSDIQGFQKLYDKTFGVRLSKEEARKQLAALVRSVELTYQPISLQQLERLVENNVQKKHGKL